MQAGVAPPAWGQPPPIHAPRLWLFRAETLRTWSMNTPSACMRVLDAGGTGVTERDKLTSSTCRHGEGEGRFCSLTHSTPSCLVNYFPNCKYDPGALAAGGAGVGAGAAEGASGLMPGQDGTFSKGSGRSGVRKRAWATLSRSCHRCKSGCLLSGALVGRGKVCDLGKANEARAAKGSV